MPIARSLTRRQFGALCGAALVHHGANAEAAEGCQSLRVSDVNRSLEVGARYLRNSQRPAGNFIYAYDWKTRRVATGDSEVRQAGAAWGVALLYLHQRKPEMLATARKALLFFRNHSHLNRNGARYITYPKSRAGSLGTVALVALAHIELLRAGKTSPLLQTQLDQYLRFIQHARLKGGRFHARYRHDNGKSFGAPSSYFDGESLLALVKAARYLKRTELQQLAVAEAHAGHLTNVERALTEDADAAITKGYYQWCSMAYHELAEWSATRDDQRHGNRLIALANWMIDVHHTLRRKRNTAYAYEGIVPAYALAKRRGDQQHVNKFGCVIDRGLRKLISWQVGGPLANPFIERQALSDPLALGGVQNHAQEALLRIDVGQHQSHALLLAKQLYLANND